MPNKLGVYVRRAFNCKYSIIIIPLYIMCSVPRNTKTRKRKALLS